MANHNKNYSHNFPFRGNGALLVEMPCGSERTDVLFAPNKPEMRTFREPLFEGFGRNGAAEKISLGAVALQVAQNGKLRFVFNAFGNDSETKIVSKIHDAFYDDQIVGVFGQIADERAVNLEFLHGKPLQIAQARISGSKIVDGNFDSVPLEFRKRFNHRFDVVHEHAFGNFEADMVRTGFRFLKHFQNVFHEGLGAELAGRKVDRHPWNLMPFGPPFGNLSADVPDDPFANRNDESRIFGDGDEFFRRNLSEFRMLPTDEGFHGNHLSRGNFDDGLVFHVKLLTVYRMVKSVGN